MQNHAKICVNYAKSCKICVNYANSCNCFKEIYLFNIKMVNYKCPRCNYETDRRSSIKNHINKKKICKLVRFDIIPINYHDVILKEDNSEFLLFTEITYLKKKIQDLEEIRNTDNKKDSTEIHGNNNITNSNITININAFNESYTGHLTDGDYKQCIGRVINSVPQLIKRIHFDPEHPENHNICISNLKNNMAMCYDGFKWNMCKQDQLIDDLIEINETALSDWLESGETEHPVEMAKFEKYLELKETDGVLDQIKEEIKLMLYNNKGVLNSGY